ncbi:malto-oligosyltrehalose trehalohydrolase [Pseudorhodoferax soli]|uniref:Malto-oligosyltrehalose trehalohydrolase n=1 Tax=Pseudorhodoferax soli TaxID=545864 RepID=A0A368Y3P1_9BURK|nr:malto-oligosyltrehalose trehalohydrolase [Pseudorhodoferax soli]RCW73976.1 maltooligosyl trehalose hydrolase [Pseudorhodoferax soli]
MRSTHSMPFGASVRAGGGVDFRLWAPATDSAALVLGTAEPLRTVDATRGDDGWWHCTVADAGAGTLYRWRIDGGQLVPDPASRSNPQGVHGPSCVVDATRFAWDDDWRGRPWNEVVLYELHVGTFTHEGTFASAATRLADLAALGITAVELMPVAAFGGQFGWGYDGVLPFAPHSAYGSPDDLRAFVQHAHRLGLMVFMDVVYNHFGPDGNFLAAYAPGFFSQTHQSPWGAAINFDGADSRWVREFFVHNALYWVEEFHIDGLRLDAVHAIVDSSQPDIVQDIATAVRAAAAGRHVHLTLENERNAHSRLAPRPEPGHYDAQWNDDFHHVLHVALTGECSGYYRDYAEEPLDLLARSLTHGMVFEGSARKPAGGREACVPAPPQPLGAMVNFAHNHDQVGNRAFGERLSQLVPAEAAPLATLLALLTPATPMLFFGEEFGAASPFLYFADWQGELRDAVRAGRQREFGHAVDEGSGQVLPDACSVATFAMSRLDWLARDSPQGRRQWDLVRRALVARRRWVSPRQHKLLTGQHTARRVGSTGLAVQWRYADGLVLELDVNLGDAPLQVEALAAGPVETTPVFAQRWPADAPQGTWPAWAARWQIGPEITL